MLFITKIKQAVLSLCLLCPLFLLAQTNLIADLQAALKQAPNDSISVKCYIGLGKYYSSFNEDSCMYYYKKAEAIVDKYPNSYLTTAYIMEYGNYYRTVKNDLEKAKVFYDSGLTISRNINNKKQVNKFLANLGTVSAQEGQYYDAVKKYLEAIRAEEKNDPKDSSVLIILYSNIASFYNRLGNFEMERLHVDKIPGLIANKKDSVNYLIAAGECLAAEKKYTRAIDNYQMLLLKATQLHNLPLQLLGHSAIADIYLQLKTYDSALAFVQKEYWVATQMKNEMNEMQAYCHFGEVYNGLGNYTKAIKYFNTAIIYFRKNNIEDNLFIALKGISQSYKASGNYKNAYCCFIEYEALKEEMVGKEKQRMIAELEAQYELTDKQAEIAKKDAENKMQLEKIAQNKKQATGLVAIIIIILSLLTLVIFNIVKKQKLNIALQTGKQKIEEQAMQLAENNDAKNKLFTIIAHDLRSPINMYQGLASSIGFLIQNNRLNELEKISQNIDNTGQQLDLLLTNLMQWSNSQQNKLMYQKEEINMQDLCNSLLPIYKQIAGTKNIILSIHIDDHLTMQSGKNQLSAIIRNLLDNAIKYSAKDSIIFFNASINKEKTVLIKVSNTMKEYDREVVDNLKEMFNDMAMSPLSKNGSIGMDLIKQSVKSIHGNIEVSYHLNQLEIAIRIPATETAKPFFKSN